MKQSASKLLYDEGDIFPCSCAKSGAFSVHQSISEAKLLLIQGINNMHTLQIVSTIDTVLVLGQ
jgi:hypothetical protein